MILTKEGFLVDARSSEAKIRDWCIAYLAKALEKRPDEIPADVKFARLGLDSANSAHFVLELEETFRVELTLEVVAEHPTIAPLSRLVASLRQGEPK